MGLTHSFLRALFSVNSHMPFVKSVSAPESCLSVEVCSSGTCSKTPLEENKTPDRGDGQAACEAGSLLVNYRRTVVSTKRQPPDEDNPSD